MDITVQKQLFQELMAKFQLSNKYKNVCNNKFVNINESDKSFGARLNFAVNKMEENTISIHCSESNIRGLTAFFSVESDGIKPQFF